MLEETSDISSAPENTRRKRKPTLKVASQDRKRIKLQKVKVNQNLDSESSAAEENSDESNLETSFPMPPQLGISSPRMKNKHADAMRTPRRIANFAKNPQNLGFELVDNSTLLATTSTNVSITSPAAIQYSLNDLDSSQSTPNSSVYLVTPPRMPQGNCSQENISRRSLNHDNTAQSSAHVATSAFEDKILRHLESIKLRQKLHGDTLDLILQRVNNLETINVMPTTSFRLPLTSLPLLEELEGKIKEDDSVINELAKALHGLGGRDYKDATRTTLAKVMTNELALLFNWAGKNEKIAFRTYKISEIIVDTMFQTYQQIASRLQIEDVIKNWLKQAPKRKQ